MLVRRIKRNDRIDFTGPRDMRAELTGRPRPHASFVVLSIEEQSLTGVWSENDGSNIMVSVPWCSTLVFHLRDKDKWRVELRVELTKHGARLVIEAPDSILVEQK
jgi:hypothetical protein